MQCNGLNVQLSAGCVMAWPLAAANLKSAAIAAFSVAWLSVPQKATMKGLSPWLPISWLQPVRKLGWPCAIISLENIVEKAVVFGLYCTM